MIDFKEELKKLAASIQDTAFLAQKDEMSASFDSLNTLITKYNKKQNTIGMQVEEIYAFMEDQQDQAEQDNTKGENKHLVQALIKAADLIEDFYLFAEKRADPDLTEQAGLMWRSFTKELTNVGLCRIADEDSPFHPQLNHMEGVVLKNDKPIGIVTDVLRSGYLYKNEVYRKSSVIVTKSEEKTNE